MQNRLPLDSTTDDVRPRGDDLRDQPPARLAAGSAPDARDGLPAAQFGSGSLVARRYQIVRRLGVGGMGEVYEADDRWLGTRVALKVPRVDRLAPDEAGRFRRELARELALARRVAHPNVCRAHDVGEHAHQRFLTMELLEGETLAARLRHGALALDDARAIADQLVAGLAALHAAGIVHRDLKSDNVMLVGASRPRAVITDLGLARASDGGALDETDGSPTMMGTAAYMAPEQVEGLPVTPRSDVYALGVVLFEMLTGRLPFCGATPLVTANLRLLGGPPPLRVLRPEIPPSWERAIHRSLAVDPDDRFERVEDLAASLREDLPGGESTPVSGPPRARDLSSMDVDHTAEVRRRFVCPGLVGRSQALARALMEASSMAPLDVGVLITGPAGTGKSVLARAIHDNSRRAGKPFVAINCGAIPSTLLESELFGVERGAHSMAAQRTIGKVGAARGGTLFLDEIGDLPYEAQSKLLQLLQDRQYYPVGSSQIVNADVRVLAATNVDLRERIERQQFRADLFYRLNVVTIDMPALAARRDDLPALAVHLVGEMCTRHGLPALELARATLLAIQEAPWPGQIRELANALEAGAIRAAADRSPTIRPQHLAPARADLPADDALDYREATRRFQRRFVLDVLTDCGWDIAAATRTLGVARSHLYNLISAFELKRSR